MTDQEYAREHRPPLLQLRSDEDNDCSARWPVPFDDDDLDIPEDAMWWNT